MNIKAIIPIEYPTHISKMLGTFISKEAFVNFPTNTSDMYPENTFTYRKDIGKKRIIISESNMSMIWCSLAYINPFLLN